MRILERYILRAYVGPLVWCLWIFVSLYLVLDLLGHLDEILRFKVPWDVLSTYYAMTTPVVFVQIAPFACLMATLYTVGNFNRHQELMAMRASGLGPFAIVRPLIWVGCLLSIAVMLINETVVPDAALVSFSIKETRLERPADPQRPHRILNSIQHLAAYGEEHTLLYAKTFDPVEKRMEGIVILQHGPSLSLRRKITADSAVWTGSAWRFLNGTILQFNEKGQTVGRAVPFDAKLIQAGDRPEILEKADVQAAFLNTRDLYRYIQRLQAAGGATVRKLQVELSAKPAAAVACLVMTLIGIAYAIQPIRGGTALGLSVGLGVGLLFYGLNAIVIALGKGGWLPPFFSAWATPFGFALFGIREVWLRLA